MGVQQEALALVSGSFRRFGYAFKLPPHHGIAFRRCQWVGWLDAADGEQAAGLGIGAPDALIPLETVL